MGENAILDGSVRHSIYEHFVRTAQAPSADELSVRLGVDLSVVHASLSRLADTHVIVLKSDSTEILMAHPFSAVPTNYETHVGGMTYWPNCGWDALGIAALVDQPARVTFRCADCGDPVDFSIVDGKLDNDALCVHFAVPARQWWADIEYT